MRPAFELHKIPFGSIWLHVFDLDVTDVLQRDGHPVVAVSWMVAIVPHGTGMGEVRGMLPDWTINPINYVAMQPAGTAQYFMPRPADLELDHLDWQTPTPDIVRRRRYGGIVRTPASYIEIEAIVQAMCVDDEHGNPVLMTVEDIVETLKSMGFEEVHGVVG